MNEAVERYRAALHVDPLSVTAAVGLARTAHRAGNLEGSVASTQSLGELSVDRTAKCRYFVDASDLLLSLGGSGELGSVRDCRYRAATLLERAMDADPNSILAATRLASLRDEDGQSDRIIEPFRKAIEKAADKETIVLL